LILVLIYLAVSAIVPFLLAITQEYQKRQDAKWTAERQAKAWEDFNQALIDLSEQLGKVAEATEQAEYSVRRLGRRRFGYEKRTK
jgi:hypothetical protein